MSPSGDQVNPIGLSQGYGPPVQPDMAKVVIYFISCPAPG
jgi:hypothetical protein